MKTNFRRAAAVGFGLCLLSFSGAAPGAEGQKQVWSFDDDQPGEVAAGFAEEVGQWRVVEAEGRKVLAQQAKNPDKTFNVCLVKASNAKDLGLEVRFKAVAGELDQGGGVVWRARDAKNYYIARYNPLEDNYRLYKVVDGKRTQLATADIKHTDGWHALRVMMRGEQIRCGYDGKLYLEAQDATFADAGQIGIWTKADAQTYFDDLTLVVPPGAAKPPEGDAAIDWDKARRLFRRSQAGEKLTADEHAYLDKAKRARQAGARPGAPQPPPKFVKPAGFKPLTEFTADDRYKGQDGGLYGGGHNEPPPAQRHAAIERSKLIAPVDADGKLDTGRPADQGKIGLVSIGMSNTTQEFSAFMPLANADPEKSRHVVLVDGAQGGMDSQAWAEPAKLNRPNARNPWDVLDERLVKAGITAPQVQVVWLKQARIGPARLGEFPKHVETLQKDLATIVQELKRRFPNLHVAYLSSRIYAGYAQTQLNPEPYAFESAFAVRWLIRDQMEGKPELNFDAAKGEVKAPLLLWGPYLWGDGQQPRAADGLVWKPEDFAADGTHPGQSGRHKVAELLLKFFKTDPTAKPWFLAPN
ncbi:MAG TPA: hypothetical protein VMV10_05935 [Pirellulales bacterium]|nr:hypothetical protein [Pirellulales bacterium]